MYKRALRSLAVFATAFSLIGLAATAGAQNKFPDKPVRIVVPYLAGGSIDMVARLIGTKLSPRLGVPVVIDNRAGAGGTTGSDAVAKSDPDGYTLLFTAQGPIATSVQVLKSVPYDPETAFEPVSMVLTMPNVFLVHPSVPFRSVQEFIGYAKANPGKLNYGSQGVGTTPHLTGAMVSNALDIDMVHVPYRGFPPLLADVRTGRVQMMFVDTINALPQMKGDKLLALAVSGERRSAAMPDVPTFKELGHENLVAEVYFAFYAPRGTPLALREQLAGEIAQILKKPEVVKRLTDLGVDISGAGPETLGQRMRQEFDQWRTIIRGMGLYKAQ